MSVEGEVAPEPLMKIGSTCVFLEVDLFVFDRSPETLDRHVVDRSALAVHADRHAMFAEEVREVAACEPALFTKCVGSAVLVGCSVMSFAVGDFGKAWPTLGLGSVSCQPSTRSIRRDHSGSAD